MVLPFTHHQNLQQFQQALIDLQQQTVLTELSPVQLRKSVQTLQTLFQQQLSPLLAEEVTGEDAPRVSSILTEIHKQLQLLAMDVTFLQVSRQSATGQQRLTQMRDRLSTLLRYCQILLGAEC
ncbi:MAG: heterocyst frequency control protein PatD [Desertifilum sp. SIO1I2]|nr:heterocyst frequency control protein PatD [Desertifilum sp. SIO1I2]